MNLQVGVTGVWISEGKEAVNLQVGGTRCLD